MINDISMEFMIMHNIQLIRIIMYNQLKVGLKVFWDKQHIQGNIVKFKISWGWKTVD